MPKKTKEQSPSGLDGRMADLEIKVVKKKGGSK